MKPLWLLTVPLVGWISLTIGFDLRFWPSEKEVHAPVPEVSASAEDLIQSRTYLLSEGEWLDLDLPKNVTRIRLLVNAAFEPGVRDTLQRDVRPVDYPLEFQWEVLDARGGLLFESHNVFESRIHGSFDEDKDQPVVGGFYKHSDLLPGYSHELMLSLDRFEGRAARVKVRLGSHAPEIREAVVRSYALLGREEGFDRYLWERTSPTWRERLTRTNLYPPALVPESERQNLLKHRWSAVPPSGIDGEDYEERILCLFRDFHEPVRIEPVVIWQGHPVGPHWKGSIPLPDPAGFVRLEFEWHDVSAALPDGSMPDTRIRWHASRPEQNAETIFNPGDPASTVELFVEGGLLEIESPHLAEVRAWWRPVNRTLAEVLEHDGGLSSIAPERLSKNGEIDITPEPTVRKAYRVEPGAAVEFSVSHLSGQATPFRVILQQRFFSEDREATGGSPSLTWEFLDSNGELIYSGIIEHAAPLSEYDRLDEQTLDQNLRESLTRYFALPEQVAVVRFRTDSHSMLVSAATRPPDLPFVREAGDNLDPLVEEEGDRTWFPLVPERIVELAEEQRVHVVYLRRSPREPFHTDIDEPGSVNWESFKPVSSWTARRVLVPWSVEPEIRPELLSIIFQQLQPNAEYTARFPAPPGVRQIEPSLVWADVPNLPQTLSVYIDGTLHDRVRILSTQGRTTLSPVVAANHNPHQIELRTEDEFPAYMSGLEPGLGSARLQRIALRWSSPELVFDYEKHTPGDELLQMKLFQSSGATSGSEISCELTELPPRKIGPFDRWTFCRRIFRLHPADEPRAMVLGAAGETVEAGRLCVVPLGSDLPPGQYRLRLRRESGEVGYVLLFRRTMQNGPHREMEILTNVNAETIP